MKHLLKQSNNQSLISSQKRTPLKDNQKENMSTCANTQALNSKRQSLLFKNHSKQPTVIQPQTNPNGVELCQVQMQIFMNHPAFQKQRQKLTTLAKPQKSVNIQLSASKSQSKRRISSSGINQSLIKQTSNESFNNISRAQIANVEPKHYDFSSLEAIDCGIQQSENNSQFQSYDRVLMNVSKALPSFQSNAFNTLDNDKKPTTIMNMPNVHNQLDMSFSDNNTSTQQEKTSSDDQQQSDSSLTQHNFLSKKEGSSKSSTMLFGNEPVLLQNAKGISIKQCIDKPILCNLADATPKFQERPSNQLDLKLKEIIRKVEIEEKARQHYTKEIIYHQHQQRRQSLEQSINSTILSQRRQSLNQSQSFQQMSARDPHNLKQTYLNQSAVAKEISTEDLSPSVRPKFDLAKRNSLELFIPSTSELNKFQKRSRSVSQLIMQQRSTQKEDTTSKKIQNNKLIEEQMDKDRKQREIEFKFRVWYMFMVLMKAGKDPMPVMLSIYLNWKNTTNQ